jgi:hypothetical protein
MHKHELFILQINIGNFKLNIGYLQLCVSVDWTHKLCQAVIPKYGVSGPFETEPYYVYP